MLTPMQKMFVDAKLRGLSNRDSAVEAGYSPKNAFQSGARLAAMPEIQNAIDRALVAKKRPAIEAVKNLSELSGVKPKKADLADPLQFFSNLMQNAGEEMELRLKAANHLATFTVAKPTAPKPNAAEEAMRQAQAAASSGFFSVHTTKAQ